MRITLNPCQVACEWIQIKQHSYEKKKHMVEIFRCAGAVEEKTKLRFTLFLWENEYVPLQSQLFFFSVFLASHGERVGLSGQLRLRGKFLISNTVK